VPAAGVVSWVQVQVRVPEWADERGSALVQVCDAYHTSVLALEPAAAVTAFFPVLVALITRGRSVFIFS